ncbi:MAG: hypothetical protein K6G90_10060 [Clostridia bacterium]|nr:hypothetical protein [Clostridia bacterium]
MIDQLKIILKLIVAVLPIVVLCLFSRKVNLKKPERSKQFFMPAVTAVYSIAAMLLINKINEWLLRLIDNIPKWISNLSTISWMPEKVASLFVRLSDMIRSLLDGLSMNFWVFFIANAVILLVYLILKRFIISIMKRAVKTDGRLFEHTAAVFYEYDEDHDRWCVKEDYSQTRNFLHVMYIAVAVISVVLMLASKKLYDEKLFRAVFYPVFGIMMIGELYFCLDGLTMREYASRILGEDDLSVKTVNYTLIRKYLRSLFGDKLSAESTGLNNDLSYTVTNEEILRDLLASEDHRLNSFAVYYDRLEKSGFEIDHNYFYSSLDLLNGKSILFNNPFYSDLIPYAFYPMNRTLLTHEKVLVILGRHAIEDDIVEWLQDGIGAVTNIPFMWKIDVLDEQPRETDIGILTRSQVLNISVHDANEDFLNNVGFVVIIEPSRLISTAQIGLNMIVKKCLHYRDRNVVYCLCDKNCDGLVDAMSHILLTSITEVAATGKYHGTSSYMCWDPDDEYLHHRMLPNISRYLGVGTELSFAALKNQVSAVKWYGGEAFPVTDIRWIDKQYYYELMKYADLPASQEEMDERFLTTSNFWSAPKEKHNYITVEDESFNMFEILRSFSTRATEQGFVNVISSDYMLRDYMADNASIFETDPKAIPYIVADFVRSERNVILKLILMMTARPTSEEMIKKEFSLLGIRTYDLKNQLWYWIYKCYSDIESISKLPEDYREAVAVCASLPLHAGDGTGVEIYSDILCFSERFNISMGEMERVWSIKNKDFISMFVSELRSASYVTEDEKGEKYYFGSELTGHVYQKYLPGQFFTFDGKYYEMLSVTAEGHMLVRRAADHITGRKFYRQLRRYTVGNMIPDTRIGACKDVAGMRILRANADITVDTEGYYLMDSYGDFRTARKVLFDAEVGSIPVRRYRNKSILRIDLPDTDGKLTDSVRYTIAVMMNEVFRTIFAENQAFITALTDDSFITDPAECRPLTCSIVSENSDPAPRSIFILEDSQLDLGLLDAVERNLSRIMQIVEDYIDWHYSAMESSLNPPVPPSPVPYTQVFGPVPKDDEEDGKKKKGFFEKLKSLFKRKNKKEKAEKKKGKRRKKKRKGEDAEVEPVPPVPPVIPEGEDTPVTDPDGYTGNGDEPPAGSDIPENSDWEETVPQDDEGIPVTEPDGYTGNGDEPPAGSDIPEYSDREETVPQDDEGIPVTEPDGYTGNGDEPPAGSDIPEYSDREENVPQDDEDIPAAQTGAVLPDDAEENVPPAQDSEDLNQVGKNESESTEIRNGDVVEEQSVPPQDLPEMAAEYETDTITEDDIVEDRALKIERKPYHERYYMLFGHASEPLNINLKGTKDYLFEFSSGINTLRQAREGIGLSEYISAETAKDKKNLRYCDFCGVEILGVEFETLADGRDRCMNCSRTTVRTEEEFKLIFQNVKHSMESFFGIRINAPIRVEMVNSRTLHKKLNDTFVPTKNPDPRTLGVAINSRRDGFSLLVENGSPRMMTMMTVAHELTHIWQYLNWDSKAIRRKYGKDMELEIYEGMAKWAEIQFAFLINEPVVAKRAELNTMFRKDEYGRGFLRYRANYPISRGVILTGLTPFLNIEEPLDPSFCCPLDELFILPPEMPQTVEGPGRKKTSTDDKDKNDICNVALKGAKDRDPVAVKRYAYELLTDSEKALYDRVYAAIAAFETDLTDLAGYNIPYQQVNKVVSFIRYDHPEIFWYSSCSYSYSQADSVLQSIMLTYNLTQHEAAERQEKIDMAIGSFLSSVTDEMSDFETVLKVYENIIKLIDYDTIGLDRQKAEKAKNGGEDNAPDDLRSIYGVFVNKKAVCAGYAKATQYLLNKLGIECVYYENNVHAWNLVKLEGEYYHLDTTWGDSSNTKPEKNISDDVSYDCFCITSEEVAKLESHELKSELPIPECTAVACNYYNRFGLVFDAYDFVKIRDITMSLVSHGTSTVAYKCSGDEVYQTMRKELIENRKFIEILQYINLKSDVRVGTEFTYFQSEEMRTFRFKVKVQR